MPPSPVNLSTKPSKRPMPSEKMRKKRCMSYDHASGSSCRELHRARHVDEEDGDLLALALDRGCRLADLLRADWRVGWQWRGRLPADRQRRATAAAESLVDLDRSAAGGTPRGQSGAALRAEVTVGPVVVVTGRTAHGVSEQQVFCRAAGADGMFAERLGVPLQGEAAQAVGDLHGPTDLALPAGLAHSAGTSAGAPLSLVMNTFRFLGAG